MSRARFYYSEEFQGYDLGDHHPLKPVRIRRAHELLQCYGALNEVEVVEPAPCPVERLMPTHGLEFVEVVQRLSSGDHVPGYHRYGFGSGDNPVFPGMWEASLLYTGASLEAAGDVVEGRCRVAVNLSGGLHHAHYDRAAGFCVFNDCAVAARRLRERFDRVAYVDIDVHHGDGVQESFYDDPSVLTVSIHESGRTLFPGTGFVHEIGYEGGRGFSVNVPVWPWTDDEVWLKAWREAALPILTAFRPEAIVLQMGADPHFLDPLAHVCISAQAWLQAVRDVNALGTPIVAVGGGGYNPTTVPRMWTLACAELFGVELPDITPESFSWHEQIPTLTDHGELELTDFDRARAASYAEQTIGEVRSLLFPFFDL